MPEEPNKLIVTGEYQMSFYISTNGQMTWNAFRAWLVTDEAMHIIEDLPGSMDSYELEKWLRGGDSLRRRERIARECVSIARGDEYFRDRCIFRGDTGDAGSPSDCNCVSGEWHPFQVLLTGTEFGRLVDDLPEIDRQLCEDAGLDQAHLEDRRIVRVLFMAFVARIRELRVDCYSSAMLCLESLPCACPRKKRHDRWFVISYSSNEGQPNDGRQSNYLPWAYKTAKKAKAAVKRLAERMVPRDWDRYKIVIDDGAATITEMPRPHQGERPQHQAEIRLQVKDEAVIVPKDRLIPIDEPPVGDWEIAQANDWEMRNLTMEQWLVKLNPMNFEGTGVERSAASERYAMKCDWWRFDFSRLESWDWVFVLRHRPDLIDKCTVLDKFSYMDWCLLLRRQPQFADRFGQWGDLFPHLWCFLLRRQPQLAERLTGWDGFDADCWVRLLKDQPKFSDRCPWEMLSGYDWKELLIARPEFASRCDWGKLSGHDWEELLTARPEYAGNCDKWESIGAGEWCELLLNRPDFQEKCDWENFHWDEVSEERWVQLIARHPQLIERAESSAAVWRKISAANWLKILDSHPELSSICEVQFSKWEGLTVETFVRLITISPGLAKRCDWSKQWNADEQSKILIARPEVEPLVCFAAFSRENWVAVLKNIPKLADKCDWNAFSEQELAAIVKCQEGLIAYVPRGRIVSRRAWIDLSRHSDECRRRFLQELYIEALDGRAITDILLELPELAEQMPMERIVSEIDKRRLMLLQRELSEKTFGEVPIADCWYNCISWKGRDGIVLGVCVKGDLFSLPVTIGPCDAIVVMAIKGRSKQIMQGYENWQNQNAESHKKVELEVVPTHRAHDDKWGYDYSVEECDISRSLNRAFSSLSQLGVRSVAINGINPEGRSFAKLVEDWFLQNSSSISVVYLVDKENAHAFGN